MKAHRIACMAVVLLFCADHLKKALLVEAAKDFESIHSRYRQMVAGLYARMWQGKCFEEQDDIVKAPRIYNELPGHGGEKPARRSSGFLASIKRPQTP